MSLSIYPVFSTQNQILKSIDKNVYTALKGAPGVKMFFLLVCFNLIDTG